MGNLSVTSGPVIDFAILRKTRRVRWLPVKRATDVVRLDTSLGLVLPEKTFLVVVARGERALPKVFQAKVRPYPFTNPVWIEP